MDGNPVQIPARRAQKVDVPVEIVNGRGGELERRIHSEHHLGGLAHKAAPLLGVLGADFMSAPVFVADTPVLNRDVQRRKDEAFYREKIIGGKIILQPHSVNVIEMR